MAKSKPPNAATGKETTAYVSGPMNVRCKAHRKNGDQCKRWAIRGATVCATHGGMAPQVRKKAAERIEASLDRAALAIVRLMEHAETPPAVKLAAARDLLDRGNLGAKQMVELEVSTPKPWQIAIQHMVVSTSAVRTGDVVDVDVIEAGNDPMALTDSPPSARNDEKPDAPRQVVYVPESHFDSTPPARLDPGRASRRGRGRFTR